MSYTWWLYAHLVAVFGFFAVHGIPIFVGFRVRRERDPARLRSLLELSFISVGATHTAMFLVLVTGVVLAFLGRLWGAAWILLSLAVFIAMWAAMFLLGTKHYDRLRAAVGTKQFYPKRKAPPPPMATPAELDALLRSPRPFVLAVIGMIAIALLLWLMLFKPF